MHGQNKKKIYLLIILKIKLEKLLVQENIIFKIIMKKYLKTNLNLNLCHQH